MALKRAAGSAPWSGSDTQIAASPSHHFLCQSLYKQLGVSHAYKKGQQGGRRGRDHRWREKTQHTPTSLLSVADSSLWRLF